MEELQPQKEWGWKMTSDIFLAGTGGGLFLVSLIIDLLFGLKQIAVTGAVVSIFLIILGLIFLFAELGHKERFWQVILNPKASWISRGAISTMAFIVFGVIYALVTLFFESAMGWKVIGVVAGICALMVVMYTGLLLASTPGIPIWHSAALPVLFLGYALMSGVAFVNIISIFLGINNPSLVGFLASSQLLTIILNAVILISYLMVSRTSRPESTESVRRLISGHFASLFFGFVIMLGLVVPAVLTFLVYYVPEVFMINILLGVGSILILTGSYFLRYLIFSVGIRVKLAL